MKKNSSSDLPSYKGKTVTALLLTFLMLFITIPVHGKMMTINGDKVNLRTGPGKTYSVKWEYGSGFPVKFLLANGRQNLYPAIT